MSHNTKSVAHNRACSITESLVHHRHSRIWLTLMVFIFCFMVANTPVSAQWTTNGNDINNTNTGNVGIGTGGTAPGYKLNVSNIEDKGQIRFGLGALDSGGFLFSNAPSHAVFSGGGSWNGGWFAKAISSSALQLNTGGIMFYGNTGLTVNSLYTPTELMRLTPQGFLGIGTDNPSYKLHVQNGQINATGGLCIAGDCKTSWSQVGGGSSQWTTSGSTIFYNAGNVGIGVTGAPTRRLEVLGGNVFHQWSATAGQEFGFYTSINNNHFTSNLYYDGLWKMIASGKGSVITTGPFAGNAFSVYADNTTRAANATATLSPLLNITMAGNVGIGTLTPDSLAKLHLLGSGSFGQDIQATANEWLRMRFMTPSRTWGFFLDGGNGGIGQGKFGLHDYTASAWRMVFDTTGKVGIGTTSPLYSLDINGGENGFRSKTSTNSVNDSIATFENSSGIQMMVRGNGNVGIGTTSPNNKLHVAGSITVDGNINAKYQDLAEWVESPQRLAPGTVVVLDSYRPNQVVASTASYDTRVAGVISAQPGIALGEASEKKVLVATTGRVKVRVSAKNGPIRIGDLLVTSSVRGVAMRSSEVKIGGVSIHRPGTLIGKALEPLRTGEGEILVLLSLQ